LGHFSFGLRHVNVLDILPVGVCAGYVTDGSYVGFTRLHAIYQAGTLFVTRVERGMDAWRV